MFCITQEIGVVLEVAIVGDEDRDATYLQNISVTI
jgi:hypothetical protein